MNRIGLLGGTFNPPHNAHVEMAERAIKGTPLDKVIFLPAPSPPHKETAVQYSLRFKMAELAVSGSTGVEVSRLEEFHEGPSYTVELLEFYRGSCSGDIYFIMGSDSLADLASWKDPSRILELATLVVFKRPGFDPIVPCGSEASIVLFEEPMIEVSSSNIRSMVRRGLPIDNFVPKNVQKFILDNSLYS